MRSEGHIVVFNYSQSMNIKVKKVEGIFTSIAKMPLRVVLISIIEA